MKKNIKINNLKDLTLDKNDYIFHAGTKKENGKIISTGGRVLSFVSLSSSYKQARERLIDLINKLNWNNGFYRKDIGFKVIDK